MSNRKMEASRKSRQVCCCESKSWTKVIGWLQTILGTLTIVSLIVGLIVHVTEAKERGGGDDESSDEGVHFYTLFWFSGIACTVSVIAGILLVIGRHKMHMESSKREPRQVCCCGARSSALRTFCLQLIVGVKSLVLSIMALVLLIKPFLDEAIGNGKETSDAESFGIMTVAIMLALIVFAVVSMFGAILVLGVKKRKASYLMAWFVFQVLLEFLIIGCSIPDIAYYGITNLYISAGIYIFVAMFCIWIVNVDRKEILD